MALKGLFVEKYRPTSLDLYVGNDDLKGFIRGCIEQNSIPHLLLYGIQGTGKTTLAKLIVKNIKCDHIYINASNERNIDTIRDIVVSFASTSSFNPLKVVILDEADFLTPVAMAALRAVMEQFSAKTRFILTCNYIEKIIDPLISRCQAFNVKPPEMRVVYDHITTNILDVEGITYNKKDVANIIKANYPDIRLTINTIQSQVIDNTLVINDLAKVNPALSQIIIDKLRLVNNNTWKDIRQEVINSGIKEFQPLYTDLYTNIELIAPAFPGTASIIINEYQKSNTQVVDKELNFAACIASLLEILK
jgi:replication factor C small subunit